MDHNIYYQYMSAIYCLLPIIFFQTLLAYQTIVTNYSSPIMATLIYANASQVVVSTTILSLNGTVHFQGMNYSTISISSSSLIVFGNYQITTVLYQYLTYNKILINSQLLVQNNLSISMNTNTLNIYYSGFLWSQTTMNRSQLLRWQLSLLMNSSHEKISLTYFQNDLPNGQSYFCSSLNCFYPLTSSINQTYSYYLCNQLSCFNGSACIGTPLTNCQSCNGLGNSCLSCSRNFSGSLCSSCNNNFTILNGQCQEFENRCSLYNLTNPAQCLTCSGNLSGSYCNLCSTPYYFSSYSCLYCQSQVFNIDGTCFIAASVDSSTLTIIYAVTGCVFGIIIVIAGVGCCLKIKRQRQEEIDRIEEERQARQSQYNVDHPQNFVASNQVCSICIQPSNNILTQCGHYFHRRCLRMWIIKSRVCPYCKEPIETVMRACGTCLKYNVQSKRLNYDTELLKCEECKNKVQTVKPIIN